jgi:hypothetical protein
MFIKWRFWCIRPFLSNSQSAGDSWLRKLVRTSGAAIWETVYFLPILSWLSGDYLHGFFCVLGEFFGWLVDSENAPPLLQKTTKIFVVIFVCLTVSFG